VKCGDSHYTLACNIEVSGTALKVKRIVRDGFEVLEAPMPSLITVSSEIGLPRLPGGMVDDGAPQSNSNLESGRYRGGNRDAG